MAALDRAESASHTVEERLLQQALAALADAGLGNDTPAEAFIIGYQAGWRKAIDFAIQVETQFSKEDLQ